MKFGFRWLVMVSVVFGLLAFPVASYSPWEEATEDIELAALIEELREMVDAAAAARAASPDFLADLDALTSRFESLQASSAGTVAVTTQARTWASPVQITASSNVRNRADDIGQVIYVIVTGSTSGAVWGDGVYTADSHLAAAAVHAGVLGNGQTDILAIRILPGQSNYAAAVRHGVTSRSYSSYSLSYEFVPYDSQRLLIQDPGSLSIFEGLEGRTLAFQVTGSASGSVWGSDVYTADSSLSTAAVHAGLVRVGETSVVLVDFLPGQSSYVGSQRFDITSRNWGSYQMSYRLRNPQ